MQMWYIYTMKYHSATKTDEIIEAIGNWEELETVILSEVTQAQ